MSFSQDEVYAIEEMAKLEEESLMEQIKKISLSAWDNQLELLTVKTWLNNFTGEYLGNIKAERNLALWLVVHFVFYTNQDVRTLSKHLWWKFIHQRMEEYEKNGFMCDQTLAERYEYIIENTIIHPLGNCSGSGTNVCYFFRQSNRLKKEMFDMKKDSEYKYLLLVDDATVSGSQAKEAIDEYVKITDKPKYILTYISTDKAKESIGDAAQVISSIELDSKSKCFDENSYIFSRHNNWRGLAKKMCKHYGKKIDSHNPLGYKNGQYAFGFYYNIPNNSLPIFWGTIGGWVPLFDRYFSDCDSLEELSGEKFY